MLFMRSIPRRDNTRTLNWIMLATLGFIWGGSFLSVEISLAGFGPITVAASRVTIAAITLLLYAYIFGDGLPQISSKKDKRVWLHCLGMALFTNALPFSLLSWGQQTVTSGFAGVSMALVPLFVLPLSHKLVPGEKLSRAKVTGFLFGFWGVVLLCLNMCPDSSLKYVPCLVPFLGFFPFGPPFSKESALSKSVPRFMS